MFESIPILNVLLSVIICWSLFAIFCSFVHEAIAQIKEERGRFMKNRLLQQLFDKPNGVNWGALLYMHGSIDLLTRSSDRPTSDIEPRLFAETLIEVVGNSHMVQSHRDFSGNSTSTAVVENFRLATKVLRQSDCVEMFRQAITHAEIVSAKNGDIDPRLLYPELVTRIAQWYTELTQRLTIWYKRKTRVRLFLLGVMIALVINVDSFQLFAHFNSNEQARNTITNFYEKKLSNMVDSASAKTDSFPTEQQKQLLHEIDSVRKQAMLPVGWDHSVLKNKDERENIFWKIFGLLISGFAASFGAPFWFEVLKRMYSVKIPKN